MTAILITGMSGTGKSTVLAELARRGHRVVDTDDAGWGIDVPGTPTEPGERLWREDRIASLLDEPRDGVLYVAGCVANQGAFSPRFAAIVLLSAPEDVILERIAARTSNHFGKSDEDRARILDDLHTVEPLLRKGATAEIDTRRPLSEVVTALEQIAAATQP
jgi:dephospho-CoA kinase